MNGFSPLPWSRFISIEAAPVSLYPDEKKTEQNRPLFGKSRPAAIAWRSLKFLFAFAAVIFGSATLLLQFAVWAVYLDWISPESPLYVLTYFPPHWLALAALPAAGLWLLAGRHRIAAAQLGIFFLFFLQTADFQLDIWHPRQPAPAHAAEASLRVAAVNLQYFSKGVPTIAAGLRSLDADVVLLSEHEGPPERLQEFARAVQPYRVFHGRQPELAVMTRLPVLEFHEVRLPTHQTSLSGPNRIPEQANHPLRSFVHLKIDFHGIPVHVISVRFLAGRPADKSLAARLEWGGYIAREQRRELQTLKRYIEKLQGPVIFGGDLNAVSSAHVVRELRAVAQDAYLQTHFSGYSGLTFRTRQPLMRIDYLFYRGGLMVVDAKRWNVHLSDHFPISADFRLPSGGQMRFTHSQKEGRP